jgi:hypothetical protein
MPPKIVPPSIHSKSFSCPHCGAHADQVWYGLMADPLKGDKTPSIITEWALQEYETLEPGSYGSDEERKSFDAHIEFARVAVTRKIFFERIDFARASQVLINLHLSRCYSCSEITIWHYDTILYPYQLYEIEANPDLDESIQADFNEARTILDRSPRGAASLLRLCIQKLCKQVGKPGKNINADIAALVQEGLDPRIQQALDFVRVIGNEAVHPGQIDLKDDRETAATLFELVNRIAFDLITHPKEMQSLYERLPPSKREEIVKRDAPKT